MIEITMNTDLSTLNKTDIEDWLEENRSESDASEDVWQPVSAYLGVLSMQEDDLLTITSAIVDNLLWEEIEKES